MTSAPDAAKLLIVVGTLTTKEKPAGMTPAGLPGMTGKPRVLVRPPAAGTVTGVGKLTRVPVASMYPVIWTVVAAPGPVTLGVPGMKNSVVSLPTFVTLNS